MLGNDITAPVAINEFEKCGCGGVFDRDKIALVMDHFTPNKDIKAAEQVKKVREFARSKAVTNFFDVGEMGVEHALLPERGMVTAGDLVIGADSHTCTYGALGAFSTGVGSTDMAAGMATGKAWFRVPEAISVVLTGKPRQMGVRQGRDPAPDRHDRRGRRAVPVAGVFGRGRRRAHDGRPPLHLQHGHRSRRERTASSPWTSRRSPTCKEHGAKEPKVYAADADAEYDARDRDRSVRAQADRRLPASAGKRQNLRRDSATCPSTRWSSAPAPTAGWPTCVRRGRDPEGRKVAEGVRMIVIPATQKIWLDAMHEGLFEIFVDAGCAVSTPTCGPCLGGHMGILAKGERCVATTNRNFVGRMGDPAERSVPGQPGRGGGVRRAGQTRHARECWL